MNRLKLLLLLPLLLSLSALSQPGQIQQIKIVSFTVKNQLPSVIDTWNNVPGALLLVAQKPPTIRVEGVRLVIQIRTNGSMICGSNASTGLPVDNFTTRTFNVNELTGLLGGCHELKDGSYSICAQFFNIDRVAISNEVCKEFTVETPKETDYSPPTLITPENGKLYSATDMLKPVMFRWTPLVPKPSVPVTYRLKVWQLMEGQNGTTAMRTNQPIVTKDVDNITQAVVNNIYNGPCKPPYLCDFIWSVQALNREGKPMGRNNGTSEPYTFKVNQPAGDVSGPVNVFPENNKPISVELFFDTFEEKTDTKKPIVFHWTAVSPQQLGTVTYRLKVWQLMQGQSGSQAMRTNKPIVMKDVDNVTQVAASGVYTGPCKPPYLCDFIWNVEAITRQPGATPKTVATSEPTTFKITEAAAETGSFKLVAPENGKKFKPNDMGAPITFKWTALVPKPSAPVIYRLKVWQLMQGQSASEAMKTNQPIATKDVDNITQAAVSGIWTGPCRPPYLCDYVWQVQVVDRAGHPIGSNESKSELWSFKVQNNIDIEIDSVFVSCCENGMQNIYIRVKNNLASAVNIVSIKYKINGAGAAIVLTPVSPVVPAATIAGNGSQVFTSKQKCITANFLKFLVDAEDGADPDNKETEVVYDTIKCVCNACDSVKIDVQKKDLKFDANGNIVLNTNISVSPKMVSTIKAELVYYEYKPDSDDCMLCNKDSKTYGNFNNGTHSQEWNFTPPKNLGGGIAAPMVITVPPTVKCCDAVIRFCIRYVVIFSDCTVCNKLVCYEIKKEGCAKGNLNPNDQK